MIFASGIVLVLILNDIVLVGEIRERMVFLK